MIIADTKYDFTEARWYTTGKIRSTSSRLKSKGYILDRHYFGWQYEGHTTPKLAPKVLSTWSK